MVLPLNQFVGLAETNPAAIPGAEMQRSLADLQQLRTDIVPPSTGGWPFLGPTKTQILQPTQLRGTDPMPYTEGGIYERVNYVYVVQPGDTSGSVAQALYGANTRANRRKLLGHTLVEGAMLTAG